MPVRAAQGELIECDMAVAQILESIDAQLFKFIYHVLDETHLFVNPEQLPRALRELERILEENTYRATAAMNDD
ncbi:hypothetical protein BC830DRAFT_1100814 [Chytriomyces sp. MP71]|nr:hypothetical protein BC830DRAFT_1100814 [Chytriomyces sp. MP71]